MGLDISEVGVTTKQLELKVKHGLPEEFEHAVWNALGEISLDEALTAIDKYRREWDEAGSE